ncbi:unnamed protein product [Lampetra planeri]
MILIRRRGTKEASCTVSQTVGHRANKTTAHPINASAQLHHPESRGNDFARADAGARLSSPASGPQRDRVYAGLVRFHEFLSRVLRESGTSAEELLPPVPAVEFVSGELPALPCGLELYSQQLLTSALTAIQRLCSSESAFSCHENTIENTLRAELQTRLHGLEHREGGMKHQHIVDPREEAELSQAKEGQATRPEDLEKCRVTADDVLQVEAGQYGCIHFTWMDLQHNAMVLKRGIRDGRLHPRVCEWTSTWSRRLKILGAERRRTAGFLTACMSVVETHSGLFLRKPLLASADSCGTGPFNAPALSAAEPPNNTPRGGQGYRHRQQDDDQDE